MLAACEPAPRGPIVRRARNPVERSLAELRPRYTERISRCDLPAATPSPDDALLVDAAGGLRIPAPKGWDPEPVVDTVIELSDTTVTLRWRNEPVGRLSVQRIRFGNQGPVWTAGASFALTALPTCEVSVGDVGAIWRRYDPTPPRDPRPRFPFSALGEIITADSVRYRVDVAAATAEDRDALLRRISDAAIARHDGPISTEDLR